MFLQELALIVVSPASSSHVPTYIFAAFLCRYNYLNINHFCICYDIQKHMDLDILVNLLL